MVEIINLSCPTCGGRLQIPPQIDRFACGYCGNELMVKRGGGIVSLEPIVEILKDVKKGVDKSSSELAIVRLEKEIMELSSAIKKINPTNLSKPNSSDQHIKDSFQFGIGLTLFLVIFIEGWTAKITLILLVGISLVLFAPIAKTINDGRIKRYNEWNRYYSSLRDELVAKQAELSQHRRIVND